MKFLVVYEDLYNNKFSEVTEKIGDTIEVICEELDLIADYDKDKLNSEDPYDTLTFDYGFFDIWVEDETGDSAGRFMIFELGELEEEDQSDTFSLEEVKELLSEVEETLDEEPEEKVKTKVYAVLDPIGMVLDTFDTMGEAGDYLDDLLAFHNDAYIFQCSISVIEV